MDSIPEHIVQKAQAVIQSLEKLFNSTGYAQARRSEVYISLWSQVANVYDDVLRREESERDRLIQALLSKQNAVEHLETQLGISHSNLSKNTTLLEQEEELNKREFYLLKVCYPPLDFSFSHPSPTTRLKRKESPKCNNC